jgi:hypothetical protein
MMTRPNNYKSLVVLQIFLFCFIAESEVLAQDSIKVVVAGEFVKIDCIGIKYGDLSFSINTKDQRFSSSFFWLTVDTTKYVDFEMLPLEIYEVRKNKRTNLNLKFFYQKDRRVVVIERVPRSDGSFNYQVIWLDKIRDILIPEYGGVLSPEVDN